MDLLSSPNSSALIEEIRSTFGQFSADMSGSLDRFFWLHAARSSNSPYRLSIWRNDDAPPKTNHGSPRENNPPIRLCNLVLQGGGTLGLAHVGLVTGLEAAGVRFVGLAGTSAGSILAMGIAAIRGKDLTRETHRTLVEFTDAAPMDSFIDGPRPIRILIKRVMQGHALYAPQHWSGLWSAIKRLKERRGLNHGRNFETWFESVMQEQGFSTIEELYDSLACIWDDLEDLRMLFMDGSNLSPILKSPALKEHPGSALLQLITMAMPAGIKFTLPQDLYYLSPEYQQSSPARLVRTSMSIPAFLEPVVMRTNPETWPERVKQEVADLVTKDTTASFKDLKELIFLDGGMISNLPSDSFRDLMPEVPTVVVPLVSGGPARVITRRNRLRDLATDAGACVTAIRLQRDRETWALNIVLRELFNKREVAAPNVVSKTRLARHYPVAIAPIDTGKANWLNFVMSGQEKAELFEAGLTRARDLLRDLSRGVAT